MLLVAVSASQSGGKFLEKEGEKLTEGRLGAVNLSVFPRGALFFRGMLGTEKNCSPDLDLSQIFLSSVHTAPDNLSQLCWDCNSQNSSVADRNAGS